MCRSIAVPMPKIGRFGIFSIIFNAKMAYYLENTMTKWRNSAYFEV